MPNKHVITRLDAIQRQLIAGHAASATMSSASKGNERELFVKRFLEQVFPNPYRFGDGDITDTAGHRTGQLDVVIEYPFGPSLPIVGGENTRLYLAESVAAVIEVKSDIANQWPQAIQTAQQVYPLKREFGASMTMGPSLPKIPVFVVGFEGWKNVETVQNRLKESPEINGVLIINHGIFVAGPEFEGTWATGCISLWGLIICLHRAMTFLKAVSTNPAGYVT